MKLLTRFRREFGDKQQAAKPRRKWRKSTGRPLAPGARHIDSSRQIFQQLREGRSDDFQY